MKTEDFDFLTGGNITFKELLLEKPIELIPEEKEITKEQLKEMFPGQKLVVCDFNVAGLDPAAGWAKQIEQDGILNIDHHSDLPEMEMKISSTNLAIKYIQKNGSLPEGWRCVAHHTDADSVLSAAIMRGILAPEEQYGEAAIAADHTGAENKIADLLQALQDKRDFAYSLGQLQLILEEKPLDSEAQALLEKRYADREKIKQLKDRGGFKTVGGVSYAILEEKIDGSLAPALLPDAKIILLFSPLKADPSRWEVKFRIGANAPQGLNLRKLDIQIVDPNFGGRWNAGSNKRGGGMSMSPDEYAMRISGLVDNF